MNALLEAVGFLTILPLPGQPAHAYYGIIREAASTYRAVSQMCKRL